MDTHSPAYNYVNDTNSDFETPMPPPNQHPLINLSEVIATTILSDESKDSFLTDDLANLTDVFDPSKESSNLNGSSISPDHVKLCGDKYRVNRRSTLSSCEILELDSKETSTSMITTTSQFLSSTPGPSYTKVSLMLNKSYLPINLCIYIVGRCIFLKNGQIYFVIIMEKNMFV
jgi:hypothetical protein